MLKWKKKKKSQLDKMIKRKLVMQKRQLSNDPENMGTRRSKSERITNSKLRDSNWQDYCGNFLLSEYSSCSFLTLQFLNSLSSFFFEFPSQEIECMSQSDKLCRIFPYFVYQFISYCYSRFQTLSTLSFGTCYCFIKVN